MKSVYIHIPFCNTICSYCDFCKQFYEKTKADDYLFALEKEVLQNYKGETIKTLYIGGGTPSTLSIEQLKKLFSIIKLFHLSSSYEMTFELNIDSITEEKLEYLYQHGVNRLSIGIETFHKKHGLLLERVSIFKEVEKVTKLARKIGFSNINGDIIYAIPGQTLSDLKQDLKQILLLNLEHISTYALMMEPHTKLYLSHIKPIAEEQDIQMYQYICNDLKQHGYCHYEISNFSKEGHSSQHNLVYWNNEEYYGFGLGASGYINSIRYDNTKSIKRYISGYHFRNEEVLTVKDTMCYEMILGLRKIEGVSVEQFYQKYQKKIEEVFHIQDLLEQQYLVIENGYLKIKEQYLYISNEILSRFV